MAKSTELWLPQRIVNAAVGFNSSDALGVWAVAPTSNGTNLTAGTRTLTAAGGTLLSGGAGAATWTMAAKSDGSNVAVCGTPHITNMGEYKPGAGPTASANAPTVDSGSSNATFGLSVGIVKLLYTAGSEGAIVRAINANSSDSNARLVTLLSRIAGSYEYDLLTAESVDAYSGSNGIIAVKDMLNSSRLPGAVLDAQGKRILLLAPGTEIWATVPTVAASCFMRVRLTAEDLAVSA